MSAAVSFLDRSMLQSINRPVVEARGLPREAYTDAAFLALEREHVFDASWSFIGAGEDIPNPGDVVPLDLIGRPIVMVRQRDGGIKAFHNVCRHRGVVLVEQAQQSRPTMVCPYHAWAYGLDGALLKTPHFSGDGNHSTGPIERDCLDLKEIRCETWNGLVFVNLSGTAESLAEHMAPVARRYPEHDFAGMRLGRVMEFTLAANWKLPIENFIEGYHLPWTHPFLNSVSSMANHYSVVDEPIAGQGSALYERDKAGHAALPMFPNIGAYWATRAEYPSLMPNLMLGVHADHINVWGLYPIGTDRVLERVYFFYAGDGAMAPEMEAARKVVENNLHSINLEDVGVVEAMQRGRASPGYVDPRFSPYQEACVHSFERRIANAVAGGLGIG
jgi:choline monooxygenase